MWRKSNRLWSICSEFKKKPFPFHFVRNCDYMNWLVCVYETRRITAWVLHIHLHVPILRAKTMHKKLIKKTTPFNLNCWNLIFFSVVTCFSHIYFFFSFYRVQNLKETIERLHGIPATKQVLMISGGEVLNSTSRVCSYSSGTDENPIYMFSILFDNSKLHQPWPSEIRKYLFCHSI